MRNKIFTILTLFLFYGCESNPMGSCSGGIGVSAPSVKMFIMTIRLNNKIKPA